MAIVKVERTGRPLEQKPHDYLVARARAWLVRGGGCRFAFAEFSTWSTKFIPDALGFMEDGKTIMVECKVSRADFHGDKNKAHHKADKPVAHFQYYLCEKHVIEREDVEALAGDWGLLWIKPRSVSVIKHPKNRNFIVYGHEKKYKAAETYSRYIMTSALFRAEKKGLIPRLNKAFDNGPATWWEICRETKGWHGGNYLGPI